MKVHPKTLYHIYNQGNNKEVIFKDREDYQLFMQNLRRFVSPHCELLCYCLMPNHYHFLVLTTKEGLEKIKLGSLTITKLSNGFRLLQSNYASKFNKKYKRSGSLFRQKAKYKSLENNDPLYPKRAFRYILYNPKKAGLVNDLARWEHGSYFEIIKGKSKSLFNYNLCQELIQFSQEDLMTINGDFDDPSYFD